MTQPAQLPDIIAHKYKVKARLGSGGHGTVFRATHLDLLDDVAIKVLNPNLVDDEEARQRFLREAKLATSFVHKYAVQLRDFGRDPDLDAYYFTMDLVEGKTLLELLDEVGILDEARIVRLMSQVLEVLGEAHRSGIVHRDIKPANLIVTQGVDGEEEIRILDFGVAKAISQAQKESLGLATLTMGGMRVGTLLYMSPEQAQGLELDGRSDLYAIGALLYEALSGRKPCLPDPKASNPAQSFLFRLTAHPPTPLGEVAPHVSPQMQAVVHRSLEKLPEERFQDAESFREALLEAASASPKAEVRGVARGERAKSDEGPVEGHKSGKPDSGKTSTKRSKKETSKRKKTGQRPAPLSPEEALAALSAETSAGSRNGKPETRKRKRKRDDDPKPLSPEEAKRTLEQLAQTAVDPTSSDDPAPMSPAEAKRALEQITTQSRVDASMSSSGIDAKRRSRKLSTSSAGGSGASSASRSRTRTTKAIKLPPGVKAGSRKGEFVNERDNSTMVYVPPGQFVMGIDRQRSRSTLKAMAKLCGRHDLSSQPAHPVTLTRGFLIAKTPITWKQYRRFCQKTGRPVATRVDFKNVNKFDITDQHPAVNLTWQDAHDYAKWCKGRLPTEAEWEFAARGPDEYLFPWGNYAPSPARLNWEGHPLYGGVATSPVGSFAKGASPYGALDMAGNVFEWVRDIYGAYDSKAATDPKGAESGTMRVIRGGCWSCEAELCTSSTRLALRPDTTRNWLGFRIVRPL